MTKDNVERIKKLKQEVIDLGRNPKDYRYDLSTQNAYRIERTKLGSFAYVLVNDKQHGKEAKVDLDCFYTKRIYSFRWNRSHSDPRKDYPHTNTYDSTGKRVNLQMHALVMGTIDGKVIDHNDGDHYNASRSNLNHVTTAQNNQNRHTKFIHSKHEIPTLYVPLFA